MVILKRSQLVLLLAEIAVIFLLLTHFRKLDSHTKTLDHHIEKLDSHVSELEWHTERVEVSVDKLCTLLDIEGKKRSPRRKK